MITFESKAELEVALSLQIAQDLKRAIDTKGGATLLLSGGSTPSGLYKLLSNAELNWSLVKIGLVDERFVPLKHPQSNFKLLEQTIAKNQASAASILPMVLDEKDYKQNLKLIEESYSIFSHPDVALLGMGADGHTASIFPNDPASLQADQQEKYVVSNCYAPTEPKQRITLNGPVLRKANSLYLMITGTQKKDILEQSSSLQLPIASFLSSITNIYYSSAS